MSSEPYQVIADGVNVPENFDFMSYCILRGIGFGGGGDWVSPINWEAVFHNFDKFARFSAAASSFQSVSRNDPASASASTAKRRGSRTANASSTRTACGWSATGSNAGFRLTSVGPQIGPPLASGNSSHTAHGSVENRGQVIATTPDGRKQRPRRRGPSSMSSPPNFPPPGLRASRSPSKGAVIASRRQRAQHPPRVRDPGTAAGGAGRRKRQDGGEPGGPLNPDHQALSAPRGLLTQ